MKRILSVFLLVALLAVCTVPVSMSVSAAERISIKSEKITIAPTIDGKITQKEWGKPFVSDDPANNSQFYATSGVDEKLFPDKIELYIRWDDTNLYVGGIVTDSNYYNDYTNVSLWMGDSFAVDICVSEDNSDSRWRTNSAFSTRDNKTYSYLYGVPNANKDGIVIRETPRTQSAGNGYTVATKEGNTVTYEMVFPWSFYGADATIKVGHKIAVNFQFHLADGSKGEDDSTYLGYLIYATKDGNDKRMFPSIELIAEKNPPKVSSAAPESSESVGITVPEASSSETEVSSQTSVSSETVTDTASTESSVEDKSDEENDGGFPLWAVIAIAVVGVAVIAAVTVLVLHKKK